MNSDHFAIQRTRKRPLFEFHLSLLDYKEAFVGSLKYDLYFSPFFRFVSYLNSKVSFATTGTNWCNFAAYHPNTVRCSSDDSVNSTYELLGFEEMGYSNFSIASRALNLVLLF